MKNSKNFIKFLKDKSKWVRRETLRIYMLAPEVRLASSLSDVEIFTVLYYGKILNFNPANPDWKDRDRFIISKAHGAISLYPILADLEFFDKEYLNYVCKEGSILGAIPDSFIPGFETINGALGHGLGVASGIAIALKKKKSSAKVFVLIGDGELYEGSTWEAIMFASHHKLNNLILIVDNNKICMLDYCKNIIDLKSLEKKFKIFDWKVKTINGHIIESLYGSLKELKEDRTKKPKVLIADTVKGKGVPQLENDALCHVKSLKKEDLACLIKKL